MCTIYPLLAFGGSVIYCRELNRACRTTVQNARGKEKRKEDFSFSFWNRLMRSGAEGLDVPVDVRANLGSGNNSDR